MNKPDEPPATSTSASLTGSGKIPRLRPDLLFKLDAAGVISGLQLLKPEWQDYAARQYEGCPLEEVLAPEAAASLRHFTAQALRTGETQGFSFSLLLGAACQSFEARLDATGPAQVTVQALAASRPAAQESGPESPAQLRDRRQYEQGIIQALEKERALSRLKSDFITVASHEFRTPLTTILSSAELVELYGHKWPPERTAEHFRSIRESVEHITGMLNQMLLYNEAESGQLNYQPGPLRLSEYCRELLRALEQGSGREHHFEVEIEPHDYPVLTDARLVRHIVNNLVSNAILYSKKGSRVRVGLNYRDGQAILAVGDEGVGIPPGAIDHLFDLFFRAENAGNTSGLGLGLPLVRQCLHLLNGTIRVESAAGQGTVFTACFPCPDVTGEAPGPGQASR